MVSIGYEPVEHLPYIDENISPEERANVEQLIRLELANQFNTNFTTFTHQPVGTTQTPVTRLQHSQQQEPLQHLQDHALQLQPPIGSDLGNMPMHPLVETLISPPNGIQSTMLEMSIQRYQEEEDSDAEDDEHMNEGVDLTKYTNFALSSPLEESSSTQAEESINYDNLYTTLGHATLQQRNLDMLVDNRQELHASQLHHLKELNDLEKDLETNVNNKRKMIEDVNTLRKKRQLDEFKPARDYLQEHWRQGINTALELKIEEAKRSR
ncbi:hypothetical protein CANMA_001484 [Candida margitis]|uniref:uncharacterized protein n=1 Tax=Candida margitis TaxID=1775924 RepID=UPI00222678B9|nr:uncharacterized protein CANMA_001484 [Candida margitis]KAI5969417.1 hypothetical protein CANMA_001484 [Candida margitis]